MIYFTVCLIFIIICLSLTLYRVRLKKKLAIKTEAKRPIYKGIREISPCSFKCESIWTTQKNLFPSEITILNSTRTSSEKSSIKSNDCTNISIFTNNGIGSVSFKRSPIENKAFCNSYENKSNSMTDLEDNVSNTISSLQNVNPIKEDPIFNPNKSDKELSIPQTEQIQTLRDQEIKNLFLKSSSMDSLSAESSNAVFIRKFNEFELECKESDLKKIPSESDTTNLISGNVSESIDSHSVESFMRETYESD